MKGKWRPQGKRQWFMSLLRIILLMLFFMSGFFAFTTMPGSSFNGPLYPLSGREGQTALLLATHVRALAQDIGPRHIWRISSMEKTVNYLEKAFAEIGYKVSRQEIPAYENTALNLEVVIPGSELADEIVVVGAHYDTVADCPGANDNGSGVAALVELARLLAESRPKRTVRFVAFANEEPPFYFSKDMGSRHYAKRARSRQENIVAMFSLETMGYYSDEPGSQSYPFPFSFFYPSRANFIGFVGNTSSRHLVRQAIGIFRKKTRFPSEGLAAPGFITGVGWSDHWSFWQEGYPAIMVTDTAFFRYIAYHTPADTSEKLDYERLARVVVGLAQTIEEMAGNYSEDIPFSDQTVCFFAAHVWKKAYAQTYQP